MDEGQQLRSMWITPEDRQKIENIKGDKFTIKALDQLEIKKVAQRLAIEYNGLSAQSYSTDHRYIFERNAHIDISVVESPEWWTSADECLDTSVLDELYTAIVRWNDSFQEKLKKNKFSKRGTKTTVPA